MRRFIGTFAAAVAGLVLSGCATAPQQALAINDTALAASAGTVGVAMAPLPKVDTNFPGADCLLCLAVASAANSSLTAHVKALPYEDLPELKKLAASAIAKKGAKAVVIDEDLSLDMLQDFKTEAPNFARKDFRPLREKHKLDKIVVLHITALGVWRNYASYVPTSDPKAVLKGAAYMVNLSTNALEWYVPIDVSKGAGVWDQPPKFPDLSNAYFQAIELSKDAVLKPLN